MKRILGYTLLECGVLLFLFGITVSTFISQEVFYGIDDSWPMLARVALIVLAAICVFGGFKFITFGLRTFQPTAEQLLSSDPRPPVVFLRSFNDDTLTVPLGGRKRNPFNSIPMNAIPDPTAESGLAATLNRIGPPVAIGRPGEILPQLGAARAYVPDSEWQEKIAHWMRICRTVIIMVHHATPGTHWELNHAVANLLPQRLVLYFPKGKAPGADREAQYAACSDNLLSKFPKGLHFLRLSETLVRLLRQFLRRDVSNVTLNNGVAVDSIDITNEFDVNPAPTLRLEGQVVIVYISFVFQFQKSCPRRFDILARTDIP